MRGVVRTDLRMDQASAIDPLTVKKDSSSARPIWTSRPRLVWHLCHSKCVRPFTVVESGNVASLSLEPPPLNQSRISRSATSIASSASLAPAAMPTSLDRGTENSLGLILTRRPPWSWMTRCEKCRTEGIAEPAPISMTMGRSACESWFSSFLLCSCCLFSNQSQSPNIRTFGRANPPQNGQVGGSPMRRQRSASTVGVNPSAGQIACVHGLRHCK